MTDNPISEKEALGALRRGFAPSKKIMSNQKAFDRFLESLERKLKDFPVVGDKLAYIPVFVMLVKSYVKKEYTEIPTGSIIASSAHCCISFHQLILFRTLCPGLGISMTPLLSAYA